MDAAGRPTRRRVIFALALAFVLGSTLLTAAQEPQQESGSNFKSKIRQLFEQSRWQEVVEQTTSLTTADADLRYYCGSALAHLGRWNEARNQLLAGYRQARRDKRFPEELAGVAFKQKRYSEAAIWLHRALRIDPEDSYADDFLGTVYFLEGNLEAALKYWNRIDKPQIESIRPEHALRIRPALLDHALAFAPASTLRLPDLLTSRSRVEGLGIFPAADFRLAAREDGKFDVVLNLQERNGWGNNAWEALLSTFRGVAYQTVYPEYFNVRHSAINITSLVRWDAQKRRLGMDLSGPLHLNPKWRYRAGADLRNENWALRESFTGAAPVLGSLNLRREAASLGISSFNSGRWGWSAGAELSHRDFRSVNPGTAVAPELLLEGSQLKQMDSVHYELWRVPDHRLVVSSEGSLELARIWAQPAQLFAKEQGSMTARWLPRSEGDDYAMQAQVRGGGTEGSAPFDELYMLGLERDNDLWMRAHIGTRDGRKGSAPLGRRYFLANSEVDKNVYSNGLISVRLSPFLDSGRIADPGGALGTQKWLWDTGVQAKIRVLGVGLNFVWGKDLRTGHNAWYFTTAR